MKVTQMTTVTNYSTQLTFTCTKLTIEALKKDTKYV